MVYRDTFWSVRDNESLPHEMAMKRISGPTILRGASAAIACSFLVLVGYTYFEQEAGTALEREEVFILAASAFALLVPASYAFRGGNRRNTLMMIGSAGLVLVLGSFMAWVWVALIADGFSLRSILRGGFPRNLLFVLSLAILAANAITCLRSLRRAAAATEQP
jgi:hypothetical protein